jgi:hypothetical protein
MKTLGALAFVALLAAWSVALSAIPASSAIVCNTEGDCWHTTTMYQYRPAFGLTIHPDDWRWRETENYRWREHEGRGYWRGDRWEEF